MALTADVEQAGVEGQCNRHSGEHQRGAVVDRLANPHGAEQNVRDVQLHRLNRVLADQNNQQACDGECQHELQDRNDAVVDDRIEFA